MNKADWQEAGRKEARSRAAKSCKRQGFTCRSPTRKQTFSKEREARRERGICYETYHFAGRERLLLFLEGAALVSGGAYFFYRSVWAVPFLLPLLFPWYRGKQREAAGRRKERLTAQFKEAVLVVCTGMQAGYSAENAFIQAKNEMLLLCGARSDIYDELAAMTAALQSNIPLEQSLLDFGERSKIAEIQDFAQVFAIGKRSSGNIRKIIQNTVRVIGEKIEVKRDIRTALGAKALEQRVMSAVPFAILFYIDRTSPGFFEILYHNPFGITVMTGCLLFYLGALLLGRKIVDIKV